MLAANMLFPMLVKTRVRRALVLVVCVCVCVCARASSASCAGLFEARDPSSRRPIAATQQSDGKAVGAMTGGGAAAQKDTSRSGGEWQQRDAALWQHDGRGGCKRHEDGSGSGGADGSRSGGADGSRSGGTVASEWQQWDGEWRQQDGRGGWGGSGSGGAVGSVL